MRDKRYSDSDPIAAERIREALDAPVEEREAVELPQPAAIDSLQRWSIKPSPSRSKGRRL